MPASHGLPHAFPTRRSSDLHPALLRLAESAAVREFALRALTDRKSEMAGLEPKPFIAALADETPRVRAQAAIDRKSTRLNSSQLVISYAVLCLKKQT